MALPVALEKVARLLDTFETSEINVAQALDCWGIKPRGRAGARLIDTLVSYGLIRPVDDDGSRRIRISRSAMGDYFSQQATAEQRDRAVQGFALKPAIFQVIWERWDFDAAEAGGVKSFLVDDLGYSARTAETLLRDYRYTVEFARSHGLRVPSPNRGGTAAEGNGDRAEYADPASDGRRELSDDTHTDFDIDDEVDVDVSPASVRPDPVYVLNTGATKPKPRDSDGSVSATQRKSAGKSVYGVTVLQEVGRFQVSSQRKIYLMADGPVNRGDLESLFAQLALKLEIGDIDDSDQA